MNAEPTYAIVPSDATAPSLELAIAAWLHECFQRTNSARTRNAYGGTLARFRAALRENGLDLDSENTRAVQTIVQAFVHAPNQRTSAPVAAATANLRRSILSSFYTFAQARYFEELRNPTRSIKRRPVQAYAKARALPPAFVQHTLSALDLRTLAGTRDFALFLVAVTTGRRLSELAGLAFSDIEEREGGRLFLTWCHCKGGKVRYDLLDERVSAALRDYLRALRREFGPGLVSATNDSPVWRSFDHRPTHHGAPLSTRGIEYLCERAFGTTNIHRLRHTFAVIMEQVGARLTEIQERLGHSNPAITGGYLHALHSEVNTYAHAVTSLILPDRDPEPARNDEEQGPEDTGAGKC